MASKNPLDRERAWSYLLDLLARRDYTEAELRERLSRRGVPARDADGMLERLRELRLVDDARFAESYVATRRRSRGRIALRAELRRKGVDPALVERELEPLSRERQVATALALLERFAWRYRPGASVRGQLDVAGGSGERSTQDEAGGGLREDREARRSGQRERARAFAFLARRGFTADVASDAVARSGWWSEEP